MRLRLVLTLTVLTAFVLVAGPSRAEAKYRIAVLGVEPDDAGATAEKTANLARWATDALRARAQQARAKFDIGANTDKNVGDLKLVSDCLDEKLDCMVQIGQDLGVERMVYGKLSKTKTGWVLSLKYLNVAAKKMEGQEELIVSAADASEEGVRKVASAGFARVAGIATSGSIEIQANVDSATVLVDGTARGTVTGRAASIAEVAEGSYTVQVQAPGYKPWEKKITVRAGEPTLVVAELEPETPSSGNGGGNGGAGGQIGGTGGAGGGGGIGGPGGGPGDGGSGSGYKVAMWSALVVTVGGAAAFSVTGLKVRGLEDDKLDAIAESRVGKDSNDKGFINAQPGEDACAEAEAEGATKVSGICSDAKNMATVTNVLIGVTVVAGVATAYFYYKQGQAERARARRAARQDGQSSAKPGKPKSEKKGTVLVAPTVYEGGAGLGAVITF
jgi:hypothetical protein